MEELITKLIEEINYQIYLIKMAKLDQLMEALF